ncbi:hypothetical protein MRX96_029766 [Rhipicephalus microplus]
MTAADLLSHPGVSTEHQKVLMDEASRSSSSSEDLETSRAGTSKDAAPSRSGKSKYGLTVHTASHKRQVPFECLLCGMKFAAKGKFRGHVRNHSLERPYACHLCPANFIQKYHLRSHLITHSNEKPHRCNVCQKAFGRRPALMKHMRVIHGQSGAS